MIPLTRAAVRRDGAPLPIAARLGSLEEFRQVAAVGLLEAMDEVERLPDAIGIPRVDAEGGLIRPLLTLAGAPNEEVPNRLWMAALAVQYAHEASLLHDDVIDQADRRRGAASVVATSGVARAVVQGDHLLSAAYRAAAATGSLDFATLLARAVERTVAAESAQGGAAGRPLSALEYDSIALGKAGELFGCALAAAAVLEGENAGRRNFELGRRLGLLYQRIDDLLDYCVCTETGKPSLRDHTHRHWTWLLEECPDAALTNSAEELLGRMHDRSTGESPLDRCLTRVRLEAETLRSEAEDLPRAAVVDALLTEWVASAGRALAREADDHRRRNCVTLLRRRLPHLDRADAFLAAHSRSFRFASRFFLDDDAAPVSRVYAFCRVTDDLADRPCDGAEPAEVLDIWLELARGAYGGTPSGLALLDTVMEEMACASVPFEYAEELVAGMRMDLQGEPYLTMADLRVYTYRVAGVVGLWLTRIFGIHDPRVLQRAERMGHAMQLTNILRDVGEDWGRGRLYLPLEEMRRFGVSRDDIGRMCAGAPLTAGYVELIESLMKRAEDDYAAALEAVPALPASFGRPAAVAGHLYRAIHDEIRRNRFDNLTLRAHTSSPRKVMVAAVALSDLAGARRRGFDLAAGEAQRQDLRVRQG